MGNIEERIIGITNDSIKKRFSNFSPWKVVSEYVWNGLDANATVIKIILNKSELGGIDSIEVHDNGDGIDFHNIYENFDNWDDSSKKEFTQRGSQGRGRYSFHTLASKCCWYTRNNSENAKITIDSSEMKRYQLQLLTNDEQNSHILGNDKGTSVYLTEIPKNKAQKIPLQQQLIDSLSKEFGWRLIINENISIQVNGEEIKPPEHELFFEEIEIENEFFITQIIRWVDKPTSEKSYNYFYDYSNKCKYQSLSGFNYKNSFFISGYIHSEWFDGFNISTSSNSDLFHDNSKVPSALIFKKLQSVLKKKSRNIYKNFLINRAELLINEFDAKGFFPTYSRESELDRQFRVNHTKQIVKNIYIADPSTFSNLSDKHTKIIVVLLDKLTVSNENDSLFDVLESVLDLEKEKLDEFASQIKKSKLDHIISTISVLQKRASVVQKLEYLFDNFAKEVLETPDLQKIIEQNTWLFGPQYEIIGAEEDDFQKIALRLRNEKISNIDDIEPDDLIDNLQLKDVRGQVDLFLARRMITVDMNTGQEHYKCTIIEIKRPGIALNDKHLSQIQRYAKVISQHTGFSDPNMNFDIILVGRHISKDGYMINETLKDNVGKAGQGLVFGNNSRIKGYVKTWKSIFNDFNITNKHLLPRLNIQRESLENKGKDELVSELQSKTT